MKLGSKISAFIISCGSLHFTVFPWILVLEKQNVDFIVYAFIMLFTSIFFALTYYLWSTIFCPFKVEVKDNKLKITYLFHHFLKPKYITEIQQVDIKEILHHTPSFKGKVKTVIIKHGNNKEHHIASERLYKNLVKLYEFLDAKLKILTRGWN